MSELKNLFSRWIATRQLLRIEVVREKAERQSFAGRLLQYSEENELLLIYHDDEKQIYNFKLNEIDSIQPAGKGTD
ncbi:hypothetical protein EDM56_07150 [Brevibacillus fluminis]|uniref:DUF2642 domain-containing protein n=1 Tax=Brevibacillus fluminis TaxID=511487 RepID=A0A3M8DS59_9BACL|nr:hypothetical protein [Brevibacillus fluminis]RNB90285.1 hypothetical protein EDM56_07150 [Brevibacillus fluminis]